MPTSPATAWTSFCWKDGRTAATATCSSCASPAASGWRWRAARRAGAPTRKRAEPRQSLHADVPSLLKVPLGVGAECGERLRALEPGHGGKDLCHHVRDLVVLGHPDDRDEIPIAAHRIDLGDSV